ncbi:glycosyltransferase [Cryobacterium sp. TMT1-62]|uniref:glycosyltransferase n=1 Tax=Cryobacterium sp. TMT1-62 TaxID=1259240 RepID=UPI00106B9F2B|nr:glycosyltransferase [Cryobacterium sp. TMT1-62]TFD32936.1 glycosyltransferase [Cryobacterium sp. TMT1-62]
MPSVVIIGTRGYPSYYGGFETAVRRIAPYLADQGWDVTVYGRHGATSTNDPDVDPRVHCRVTRGVERKSLSTLSYGLTACLDAAKHKPDVALVMNVANGFWLPILKARGIPTLINVDGIEWDRAKWGRLAKWMFRSGAKLTARFGNRLVYDSRVIAQRWNQDFDTEGAFIPYGGSIPPVLPLEPGLTHRGYVLVVARFVPENTIPEFLAAAASIAEKYDVVIVGSEGYGGPLDTQAAALAESNTRIKWLGHVSDDRRLFSLWQHAGVYFHGHSVGGTNPALVQAMACGAPTVARDTPYNREVLGSSGKFVSPNSKDIEGGVLAGMADVEWQGDATSQGLRRVADTYTWDKVCQAYEANLLNLLQGQNRAMPDGVTSAAGRRSE